MADGRLTAGFARAVLRWHADHGRHGLPWQGTRDPYRVWVSEIMLQQTQVTTVLGYFERFLARFPDVATLAAAPLEDVLAHWSGLGYYARGRQAHRCARLVMEECGGRFPRTAAALARLPGIGPSTAAAIAAFCFDERAAILDANVERVLVRLLAIDQDPRRAATRARLREIAAGLLPRASSMPAYTQAIMDLGALVCVRSRPRCAACPVQDLCAAHRLGVAALLPVRPHARTARPERTVHLLVVRRRRSVLFEQRPGAGIWGGMLGLPEFATAAAAATYARALGARGRPRILDARRHALSHVTLDLRPQVCEVADGGPLADGQRWMGLAAARQAALPAPIRRLLDEIDG